MDHIFITRKIPKVGLEALKAAGHRVSVWAEDRVIPHNELLKRVKGCDAIVSMLTDRIGNDVLEAAGPHLKLVANFAAGFDNLDLAALRRRGILATNLPGASSEAVAEHTFALMMAVAKRIVEDDRLVRKHAYRGWAPMYMLGTELGGKTLGIIGTGRIGSATAKRAVLGLGMKLVYHDPVRNEELDRSYGAVNLSLDELLKTADVVSLHVPLTQETRHLINAKRLMLMKKTALLINTSRGPVIDEAALAKSLKAKRIAGAGLDVFEHEPKVHPILLKLQNVVLTPHTGSATVEARDAMALMCAKSVNEALAGRVPETAIKH